jgi:hypothetical protein
MSRLLILMYCLFGVMVVLVILLYSTAQASDPHYEIPDITINNYYDSPAPAGTTSTNEPMVLNITTGVSREDLAAGIAIGLANQGAVDYSTQDFQLNLNLSDFDGANAASVLLAKRFAKIPGVYSISATQAISNGGYLTGKTGVVIGVGLRF